MLPRHRSVLRALGFAHPRVWWGRFAVWSGAGVAALSIILFALLVDRAIRLFNGVRIEHPWAPFVLTTAGGMFIAWATRRYFPGAEGSGIPQVIVAREVELEPAPDQSRLVSVRLAIAKIALGTVGLACGFSAGREGPSVQVGASIMYCFRRFLPARFPVRSQDLILAGGAAGIAAAFNTPLAGIVFAIEELGNRMESRTNGVLLTAIVLAGVISIGIQGNYLYFGHTAIADAASAMILPVLLIGIVAGCAGGLFSRLMLLGSAPWPGAAGAFKREHPVLFAGLCGLVLAVLGYVSDGAAHGSGYDATRMALQGNAPLSLSYPLVKFAATLVSYLSGIPGGIFAPCLAIGGGLGHTVATLHLLQLSTQGWMVLGMAAFLAAVTQSPITAFVIVMEMIDGHALVVSLAAVAFLASVVARGFSPPLYHALARRNLANRRRSAGLPAQTA